MAKDGAGDMVTFRYEPLTYLIRNGLPELSLECWEKVGDEFHTDVFGPDWETYQAMEDDKSLGFIAMRDEEKLVGYAVIKIRADIHQKGMRVALIHDIYIREEDRGHAMKFMRYIESLAVMMGAYRIDGAEKLSFGKERGGAGKFYEFVGFRPMEVIWSKVLSCDGSA